jgi:hypothetical protein
MSMGMSMGMGMDSADDSSLHSMQFSSSATDEPFSSAGEESIARAGMGAGMGVGA